MNKVDIKININGRESIIEDDNFEGLNIEIDKTGALIFGGDKVKSNSDKFFITSYICLVGYMIGDIIYFLFNYV